MADAFRAKVSTLADKTLVQLGGQLCEETQLPELKLNLPIHIDFNEITRINSRGIKIWCQWIIQFKPPVRLHFEQCPAIVIKTFNLVKGCIPRIAEVDSFYVPLYSSQTSERKDVLVKRGKEYVHATVRVPEQKDSKGNVMELDVHESYWAFLLRT